MMERFGKMIPLSAFPCNGTVVDAIATYLGNALVMKDMTADQVEHIMSLIILFGKETAKNVRHKAVGNILDFVDEESGGIHDDKVNVLLGEIMNIQFKDVALIDIQP